MTWLELPEPWQVNDWRTATNGPLQAVCLSNAVQEGRATALRWLIELLGISCSFDKPYKAKAKNPSLNGRDVFIDEIPDATRFPDHGAQSDLLALVWKGCSQASAHPTTDTDHPDVSPQQLAEGLYIILTFLEEKAYKPNGRSLLATVKAKH